jgi:hypothetical protein
VVEEEIENKKLIKMNVLYTLFEGWPVWPRLTLGVEALQWLVRGVRLLLLLCILPCWNRLGLSRTSSSSSTKSPHPKDAFVVLVFLALLGSVFLAQENDRSSQVSIRLVLSILSKAKSVRFIRGKEKEGIQLQTLYSRETSTSSERASGIACHF